MRRKSLRHAHTIPRSERRHGVNTACTRFPGPPVLVRTGRRLPVQALGERRVWVALTGYPRDGAPGP